MILHNFDSVLAGYSAKAKSFKPVLTDFYGYLIGQTERTFRTLGRRGSGMFRGMKWAWFSPVRTRDGRLLDPIGLRVRHSFGVRPWVTKDGQRRKRPASHYVQANSRILQDTGRLASAALARFRVDDFMLIAETPVKYADWQNERRKFAFISEKDAEVLRGMITRHLTI